jgi:hypothetical protein
VKTDVGIEHIFLFGEQTVVHGAEAIMRSTRSHEVSAGLSRR